VNSPGVAALRPQAFVTTETAGRALKSGSCACDQALACKRREFLSSERSLLPKILLPALVCALMLVGPRNPPAAHAARRQHRRHARLGRRCAQGLLRNPLASPSLFGAPQAAAFGAVLAIATGLGDALSFARSA